MGKERDYSLCVICCYSFSSLEVPDAVNKTTTITKFYKQVNKVASKTNCEDNWCGAEDVSVCQECLTSLASAVERRENVEEIEVQVRSLQVQVLRLMKDLKQIMGGYLKEMKVIEERIESSDVACLKLEAEKNKWKVFGLRDGVLEIVKELNFFQEQLSFKVNCTDRPSNDSVTLPSVKIEVEDAVEDMEYSNPPSPEGHDLEDSVDEKVDIFRSDLNKPRRSSRSAAATTIERTRKPGVKIEINTEGFEKIARPAWHKTTRVRYKTKGVGGKTEFLCETCPGFSVRTPHHLEQHLREHEVALKDNPKTFTCPHCSISFALKQLCEFHITCHGRVLKFPCDQCNKDFAPLELEAHLKEIHGVTKIFQCDNCIFCCSKRDTYLEHLKMKHTGAIMLTCDICQEKFSSRKDHLEHLHQVHQVIDKLVCGIDGCDTTYLDRGLMTKHQLLHTRPFSCLKCDYKCTALKHLKLHQAVHRTEGTWKCDRCPLTFKWKSGLNAHLKRHDRVVTEVLPQFQCHLCEKSYIQERSLEAHLKLHRCEGYTCDQCGFICGYKAILKRHMESHLEAERTFFCDLCAKGFKWERELKNHVRMCHLNTGKFPCPDCEKHFPTNSSLKLHSTVHSGKKPWACDKCGKAFTQSCTLSRHKRLVHGNGKDLVSGGTGAD